MNSTKPSFSAIFDNASRSEISRKLFRYKRMICGNESVDSYYSVIYRRRIQFASEPGNSIPAPIMWHFTGRDAGLFPSQTAQLNRPTFPFNQTWSGLRLCVVSEFTSSGKSGQQSRAVFFLPHFWLIACRHQPVGGGGGRGGAQVGRLWPQRSCSVCVGHHAADTSAARAGGQCRSHCQVCVCVATPNYRQRSPRLLRETVAVLVSPI